MKNRFVCGEETESFKLAEEIGFALAENGYALANGGYNGTMLASAKGAARATGKVIGVVCVRFLWQDLGFEY